MRQTRRDLPRSDKVGEPDFADEVDEPDFADEHAGVGFADHEPDGPEHARDESVPAGLAGADPTGTEEDGQR